jgi:hypothetical protein
VIGSTDDQLVAIVNTYFDEIANEGKFRALMTMKCIGTARARQFLERIASSAVVVTPYGKQTLSYASLA